MRHPGLANLVIEGNVESNNCRRRKRKEYMKHMVEDVGYSKYVEMKRMTQDMREWRISSDQSKD